MKGTIDIMHAAKSNAYDRTTHNKADLFGHPHFSKVNANRHEAARLTRPKTSKARTLSIIDKDGMSVSSYGKKPSTGRDDGMLRSEYSSHFNKSNSIHHKYNNSRVTSAYAQSNRSTATGWTRDSVVNPKRIP